MILLAFFLIPAICAIEQERTISDHVVKIDGDTLISVSSTPTSSFVLNLSGLGLKNLAENAFENVTTLKDLDLGNNVLTSIPKGLFSNLRNIENISLANNNLNNFERVFEGLDNLNTLNISNNPVNALKASALSGLPKSSVVFTTGLSLEMINAFVFENKPGVFSKASNLHKRSIINDENTTGQSQERDETAETDDMKTGDTDNNDLIKICIDGDVLKKVELLTANETLPSECLQRQLSQPDLLDLSNLGIAKFEKNWYQLNRTIIIRKISLSRNNIVNLTREILNALPTYVRDVDLAHNKIERLGKHILAHKYISAISFRSNAIRAIGDFTFTQMPHLLELDFADNLLQSTRFAFTLPRTIKLLFVQRNKITAIFPNSFTRLRRLTYLFLNENLIQAVNVKSLHGLGYLKKLVLSENLISKIAAKSFHELTDAYTIDLHKNQIVGFENGTFDYMHNLQNLDISHNKLSSINEGFPDGLPPNLATLNLAANGIKKLAFNNFKHVRLTHLILSANKISAIEHGALELPSLRVLQLDSNKLVQLHTDSFCGLNNIITLNLAQNRIPSIPKRFTINMENLEELDLCSNPIHRLQNGALYGFQKTAYNRVYVNEVPIDIIEGGLFDDM